MAEPLSMELNADLPPEWEGQVNLGLLIAVAEAALHHEGWQGQTEVELLVLDDEEMREMNNRFRGLNTSTDVLSFPLITSADDASGFVPPPDGVQHLGDIVISLPRALEQARDYGHSSERELAYLFVHGILHLLGYDHEVEEERARMREREEAALAEVGMAR